MSLRIVSAEAFPVAGNQKRPLEQGNPPENGRPWDPEPPKAYARAASFSFNTSAVTPLVPTMVSTTFPPLKKAIVGRDRIS